MQYLLNYCSVGSSHNHILEILILTSLTGYHVKGGSMVRISLRVGQLLKIHSFLYVNIHSCIKHGKILWEFEHLLQI